ncbi:MAG: heme exporter protein CcmD [Granulosicoccus sp.]
MSSLSEFLHMGGYAFYVWSSYGLTVICLAAVFLWSSAQHRKALEQAIRRGRKSEARRKPRAGEVSTATAGTREQ